MNRNEVLRMCLVCRNKKEKAQLVRVVKKSNSNLCELDLTGKLNGRGAYICKTGECIAKCKKQKSLNKSFKCNIDLSIYDKLGEIFENN